MEIASIKNIRDKKNEIKDRIPEIDKNKFGDTRFGSESEFTFKGWLAGISALMTDVSCLTKAPQEFIKISTYQDHRMAMAFAPLALKVPLIIEDAEVVSKSYPTFWENLKMIGFKIN